MFTVLVSSIIEAGKRNRERGLLINMCGKSIKQLRAFMDFARQKSFNTLAELVGLDFLAKF